MMRTTCHAAAAVVAALALTVEAGGQSAPPAPALPEARTAASSIPRLHSLLVSWKGQLILEHYAERRHARLANVKSVSKSLVSALVGVAIHRGLLKGVDQPIADFFPELRRDADARKRRITIEDLLTMRQGLESTSFDNYGAWVTSRNWVRYVLDRPVVAEPGSTMEYSTGSTHLLSAILTKASGQSLWALAQEAIGRPLGISIARWPRDPQGVYFGGNDMLLTPRQMVAFGELYLDGGRANGRQVVPAAWVAASCRGRGRSAFNPDQLYGYGWWTREFGGRDTCFAWGYGGQYIFVVPSLDLVVVTTSSTSPDDRRRDHRRLIFDVLERHIIAPLAG